jgi:hypothetical protein
LGFWPTGPTALDDLDWFIGWPHSTVGCATV